MANHQPLLDALMRSDWSTVREIAQRPDVDKAIKDKCNAWLRHDRGRALAYHDLKQLCTR